MIKKILISIACFMLVLGCVFTPVTAHASTGQTYTYTDSEVYSDTSNLGNYAIDSVESLTVSGTKVRKVTMSIPSSSSDFTFRFLLNRSSSNNNVLLGNYIYFNFATVLNQQLDCNFAIRCLTNSEGLSYYLNGASQGSINGTTYYRRALVLQAGNTFEFYFSTLSFGGNYDEMTFGGVSNFNRFYDKVFDSSSDLTSFVDMDSSTNFLLSDFDFDFFSSTSGTLSRYFKSFPFSGGGTLQQNINSFSTTLSSLSSFASTTDSYGEIWKGTFRVRDSLAFNYFWEATSGTRIGETYFSQESLYFSDFYFKINRPVFRTNNTLVIYNFDYNNFLSSVGTTIYQLEKGADKYNVVYNGSLPNSYFVYVHNSQVSNIIFDQYIYLHFKTGKLTFFDDAGSSTYFELPLGFDFNFTYYNEPLVSSNGSYNFDFEKPGYVDMRFSLVPFYIPVLEAVQNALIFLIFYCPLISDILAFIHLDQFFGALFNIFSFETGNITLLGINMGSFVWACISFLIFFKLLRSFMPILWGSGKAVVSDVVARSNRLGEEAFYNANRYEAEKVKKKREYNYKVYKNKVEKKKKN